MALGFWLQSDMYLLDLSNEVLNGRGAAKILEINVGGRKQIAGSVGPGRVGNFSFDLQIGSTV